MDYQYPLLKKIFNYYKRDKIDLSDFYLYTCQHLLNPQYEMYKMFIKFGFEPKNITVLGKIYSSNVEIIENLKSLGIQTIQPDFDNTPFDKEHKKNCKFVVRDMSPKHKNIILDDGGCLINEAKIKNIYFAVEQTSSGFNKLKKVKLNFPVLNVARSKTKLTQESPIIARQALERISAYIQNNNINSPKIIIIGLGAIGNAVYQAFSEEDYNIKGFDIETDKKDILLYMKEEKPDIVIGATGTKLLDKTDIENLESNHTYHFISVSSSDREFPVYYFRKNEKVHDDIKYNNFVFVNNGFPISFKGNKYELTPIEIEKTIALLMGSVFYGISQKNCMNKGIINVPAELENLINE